MVRFCPFCGYGYILKDTWDNFERRFYKTFQIGYEKQNCIGCSKFIEIRILTFKKINKKEQGVLL